MTTEFADCQVRDALTVREGELLRSMGKVDTLEELAEAIAQWMPKPFKAMCFGGFMVDGKQHGLTLDELMAELDARRDESSLTWCYNCKELVEVEPDNGGCGCHCPDCEITL